jgi:transposase
MIQITPHMRVLVAVEAADFRRGIDGLARLCREVLTADPFSGAAFVFRNRRATAIKILLYDGQGFWLAHKRLSAGRFRWWPSAAEGQQATLRAHELQVLLFGGDPRATKAAPEWRRVEAAVRS